MEEFKGLSLNERKKKMFEDASGGMSVGGNGYEASADAEGPNAGYDPLMKTLKMLKRKRNKKQNKEG